MFSLLDISLKTYLTTCVHEDRGDDLIEKVVNSPHALECPTSANTGLCLAEVLVEERCVPLLGDLNSKATQMRKQLPSMNVPPSNSGWRTSITSSLEELEEGARIAVDGTKANRPNELRWGARLIVRATDTLQSTAAPPEPLPDSAAQAAKAFWNLRDFVFFDNWDQCPGHYWSLTSRRPGEDEFERQKSVARAPDLQRTMRNRTYVVRLEKGARVVGVPQLSPITLGDYDFSSGEFPVIIRTGSIGCKDDEDEIPTNLMGVREDEVTYRLRMLPDDAKALRSSWDDAVVHFDIAFQPNDKATRDEVHDVVVGMVKAVRMFVNAKPLLALVDEPARPWERARRKRARADDRERARADDLPAGEIE
jgi:hypothetical protein